MQRHAYLITAYDDFYTLGRLVLLLDDPRNHIYIHVDKKSDHFSEEAFLDEMRMTRLTFARRRAVYWGDYSHVKSILELFKLAMAHGPYDYFHLLSGADLPLKTQDHIHAFFDENKGKEFVSFNPLEQQGDWVKYAYPANRLVKSRSAFLRRVEKLVRHGSLSLQRALGVDRRKRFEGQLFYGSDWFSVTQELAQLLVDNEEKIERVFKRAGIPSEFFVQTILGNSDLRTSVYGGGHRDSNMRLIDWVRGDGSSPHVFRQSDWAELAASDMLFARKFDSRIDRIVIDRLFEQLKVRAEGQSGGR